MSVRVRFAPSPTGSLHVGSLRDALFKHLFARHHKGANILRIEDTDRARYSAEAEQDFIDNLHWVGIDYDEGPHVGGPHAPYRQSERKEAGIYARWIDEFLKLGHAYKAFETPEELVEMREFQQVNRQPVGYFGGLWRDAAPSQAEDAERAGKPFVIRQRVPRGVTIAIDDAIRGRIEWNSDTVDDPVLIKADGMPTYHFAAMVDDHLMGITHIMRGEEWISSAPKHAALFDAFGWERPIFVHCPVIKGKDGKKLSKRQGDTRVADYRADGYLPEALLNLIALIGWSPGGDREIMSIQELIEAFDLPGLQPSPGVFDLEKLRWMNGHYIREMAPHRLAASLRAYLAEPGTKAYFLREAEADDALEQGRREVWDGLSSLAVGLEEGAALATKALAMEQGRVHTLSEFGEATAFFFQDEPPMDAKAVEKWLTQPHVPVLLAHFLAWATGMSALSVEECEAAVRGYAEKQGLEKLGPVVHPLRVALTGRTVGPGLFELMSALGPARMAARLARAVGAAR
ncbi:MAG: glutamate--tRNA ligase [Fimbriimonas ginsengisoli]|uniref:Glutamate--tRNA ligase n=1 Tax=Fimbriimonas ginsengisoli TaxID=1005039 RepID=A0A931LZF1_FIMGI|nr:glutamate--tRNA ligase [Fimbriimonas ginsengisoli]